MAIRRLASTLLLPARFECRLQPLALDLSQVLRRNYSAGDDIPTDRMYTKEHDWVKVEDDTATSGITAYAVGQLGDITLVNIDVKVGKMVSKGERIGTIESVKTLGDLVMPLSGELVDVNKELDDAPENVTDDTYGAGWMTKVKISNPDEISSLLDAAAYREYLYGPESQ